MEHTVLLNNGESVTLVGELELVEDHMVLSNGHSTYWSNVLYCRSRVKR
jgi:hypothetical protein